MEDVLIVENETPSVSEKNLSTKNLHIIKNDIDCILENGVLEEDLFTKMHYLLNRNYSIKTKNLSRKNYTNFNYIDIYDLFPKLNIIKQRLFTIKRGLHQIENDFNHSSVSGQDKNQKIKEFFDCYNNVYNHFSSLSKSLSHTLVKKQFSFNNEHLHSFSTVNHLNSNIIQSDNHITSEISDSLSKELVSDSSLSNTSERSTDNDEFNSSFENNSLKEKSINAYWIEIVKKTKNLESKLRTCEERLPQSCLSSFSLTNTFFLTSLGSKYEYMPFIRTRHSAEVSLMHVNKTLTQLEFFSSKKNGENNHISNHSNQNGYSFNASEHYMNEGIIKMEETLSYIKNSLHSLCLPSSSLSSSSSSSSSQKEMNFVSDPCSTPYSQNSRIISNSSFSSSSSPIADSHVNPNSTPSSYSTISTYPVTSFSNNEKNSSSPSPSKSNSFPFLNTKRRMKFVDFYAQTVSNAIDIFTVCSKRLIEIERLKKDFSIVEKAALNLSIQDKEVKKREKIRELEQKMNECINSLNEIIGPKKNILLEKLEGFQEE